MHASVMGILATKIHCACASLHVFFDESTLTFVTDEKQAVVKTLTVFASFHTFFL